MTNIKQKTVSGLIWSFVDNFSIQGISFVFGIIMARLLIPKDYGLIGMTGIFLAFSQVFIYSGFGEALIRKKDCTQVDYCTVFYFNLFISIICFFILFIAAGSISNFFKEPLLKPLVIVVSLGLIINSLSIVQVNILTKRVDFKLQAKISITSAISSGTIGVSLAYLGFGVWSLVGKSLIGYTITTIMLWIFNKWRPSWLFSWKALKEMFAFSSKLLATSFLNIGYQNLYSIVIGKFFSASDLGYYSRAMQFKNLPSQNIDGVIDRVTYPILSLLQDDEIKLKAAFKKMIKITTLIIFILMMLMAAIAEPLIITLIGEKWRTCILYLQILCFSGITYPLHSLNLSMLTVLGRTDLFLKLDILKKILIIPPIIIGIIYGIKIMLLSMVLHSFIAYYLNSFYSGKFINYPVKEQLLDILPAFLVAITIGAIVFIVGLVLPFSYLIILIIQLLIGVISVFALLELFKLDSYKYVKEIIVEKYFAKNKDK